MTIVRHHNGFLEDVPPDVARHLLACGHVELAGPLEGLITALAAQPPSGQPVTFDELVDLARKIDESYAPPAETAMLAPPETAMLPPVQPRKRGRPKRARM